jgi:predicted lipid carrier protein YhbT
MTDTALPYLPRPLALAAGSLPLAPLTLLLTRLARQLMRRHPGLQRRLGVHARCRFLLDLTDMPFLLLLEPGGAAPRVRAVARRHPPAHDTRIAGLTSAFLGMLHGSLDGDALFFSRDRVLRCAMPLMTPSWIWPQSWAQCSNRLPRCWRICSRPWNA